MEAVGVVDKLWLGNWDFANGARAACFPTLGSVEDDEQQANVSRFHLSSSNHNHRILRVNATPATQNSLNMNISPIKTDPGPENATTSTAAQNQPTAPATPVSEWQSLRTQLEQDSFNTTLWNRLIQVAEDSGDLEKVKEAYEALLQKYPNTVRDRRNFSFHHRSTSVN